MAATRPTWIPALLLCAAVLPACGAEVFEPQGPSGGKFDPEARLVSLGAQSFASGPFEDECFETSIVALNSDGNSETRPGKLVRAVYGFVSQTEDEFLASGPGAWEPGGELEFEYQDLEDREASVTPRVRVPAGKNLVFRLGVEAFDGVCGTANDTESLGISDLGPYFAE